MSDRSICAAAWRMSGSPEKRRSTSKPSRGSVTAVALASFISFDCSTDPRNAFPAPDPHDVADRAGHRGRVGDRATYGLSVQSNSGVNKPWCCPTGHSSCRHVRFATDSRRERRYVCAPKAEAVPGEAPRKKPGAAVGQLGGAVAPNSAHFTPAKRCNHQVPAGKIASRPARWSARASRYRSMKA